MNLKKFLIEKKILLGKFTIVGFSGIIVNQGLLTLLVNLSVPLNIAGIISIETSLVTNFLLNNYWTWEKKNEVGLFKRFIKYQLTALISGGANYITLLILTYGGMHYFLSSLAGITVSSIITFIFSHYWTFGVKGK